MDETTWLSGDWKHPDRLRLPTGHHLRPIRADDVDLDMVAVMGSRERLWSIYGSTWGWPPADMTVEQDREDLQRHADEMEQRASYNYALFDPGETELLGCVYIDPPEVAGTDAEISWWVVDWLVGGPIEAALDELVPGWIAREWPFRSPRYPYNRRPGSGPGAAPGTGATNAETSDAGTTNSEITNTEITDTEGNPA